MAPKSLLATFNFQAPVKLGLAWAGTSPNAAAKSATKNIRNVWLRMIPLLLSEHELEVEIRPAGGYMPRNGHGFSAIGERPTVFSGEIVPFVRSGAVADQIVAVPGELGFDLIAFTHMIDALLAVGGVGHVVGHVAAAPSLDNVDLDAGIRMHNLLGHAIGRRHGAEVALGGVHLPGAAEIGFRLGLHQPQSQSQQRE